jgi:hypothetical protein
MTKKASEIEYNETFLSFSSDIAFNIKNAETVP